MDKCLARDREGRPVEVSLLGVPVDPCVYEEEEVIYGAKVTVLRCPKCGARDVIWERPGTFKEEENP